MLLVLLSFLMSLNIQAQEAVSNSPSSSSGNAEAMQSAQSLVGQYVQGKNTVEKELLCIRARMNQKGGIHLLRSEASKNMIELLSTGMEASMKKFKMMSANERAFFYAQIIVETGGFTKLSETTNHSIEGSLSNASAGSAFITQFIEAHEQNDDFSNSNNSGSAGYGVYRGRGLIQLTGCDNYLSTIHYLNQFYAGREQPYWRGYWTFENSEGATEQVTATCSRNDLPRIQESYRQLNSTSNYNANLYGAFEDPMRFAQVGATLTNPNNATQTISSVEFMTDAAIAYWRGRCGEYASSLNAREIGLNMSCRQMRQDGDTWQENANRCLTKCVRGTTNGSEQRLEYLNEALECMQTLQ